MRSWPFCIKNSTLTPSLAIDNLRIVPVQGNGDRRLARDIPVQGKPGNANGNR
jgi:hypothetical protein